MTAAACVGTPPFEVTQIWHSRYDDDPGHIWLRSMFRDVSVSLS